MIIFYPVGGLGNRMRVIESAVKYCQTNQLKFCIYWIKDSGLNCSFSNIWLPVKNIVDKSNNIIPMLFKIRRKSKFFRFMLNFFERAKILMILDENEYEKLRNEIRINGIERYLICIIASYSIFYNYNDFQQDLFGLNQNIEELIEKETRQFDKHTIGIHIRRTDNLESIEYSPLNLFVKKMKQELAQNSSIRFYIATDSEDVKSELKTIFGERVLLPNGELSRNSKNGVIEAVVELYSLSKTNKIIGSHHSSFSEMAARIGNINLQVMRK